MYQLNEQWVEKADDGKMHMYKAVEGGNCKGCTFGMMHKGSGLNDIHVCDREDDCPLEYADTIIKDLGIINEDGCLPNCWGEYPRIEERVDVYTKEHWFRCITRNNVYCATESYKTKQEAIDAWNRRA
jgi:hypothetical protein